MLLKNSTGNKDQNTGTPCIHSVYKNEALSNQNREVKTLVFFHN